MPKWFIKKGFKMKKSVPLPSGPRKAGPQNNGTVPHDPATSVDNSNPSDAYEGSIDLNVILPGDKSVQMTVESKVPLMDLLIQVTVPNKINPAGHMIVAPSETGNSHISHKPSTPIGALGTSLIYVVPKNTVIDPPRKIGPKMANQPFEQTFRLQVLLPRSQKTFLRVSPKTPLAEVLNLVCKEKGFEPIHYDVRDPSRPNEPLELGRSLADYKLNEVQLVPSNVPDFRKSTSDLLHAQQVAQVYQPTSKDDSKEKPKKKGIFTFKIPKKKNKYSQDQVGMLGEWSFTPSSSRDSDSSQPPSLRSVDSSRPALSRPLSTIVTSSNITRPPIHKKRQAPQPPVQTPVFTSSPITKDPPKEEILTTKGQNGTNHSRHSSDSSGYHEASILSDSPENSAGDSLGHVRPSSGLRTSFDDTSLDSMEINSSKMPSPIVNSTMKQPPIKPPLSDTDSSGNSNTSTLNKKRKAPNPPARPPPPVIKTNSGDSASDDTTNKPRPVRPPALPLAAKSIDEKNEAPTVVLRDKPRPIPRPRSSVDEDMKVSVSPQPRRPCSFVAPPPPPLPDSPSELPSPVYLKNVLSQSSSQTDVATETMDEFKTMCDKESHQKNSEIHDTSATSLTPSELNQEFQDVIFQAEQIIAEEERLKEGQKSEMAHFVEKIKSMTTAIEEDTSKQGSTDSDISKQEGEPSEIDTVIEHDSEKEDRRIKAPKRREKRVVEKQLIKSSEEHETSSEEDNTRRNNIVTKKSRKHVPLLTKSISENHELVIKLEETKSERIPESPTTLQMKDSDSDNSKEVQETLASITEKQAFSQLKKISPTAAPRKSSKSDKPQEKFNIENSRQELKPRESNTLPRPLPRRLDGEKKHLLTRQLSDDGKTTKSEFQTGIKYEEKLDTEKDNESGIEVLCSVVTTEDNKICHNILVKKENPEELADVNLSHKKINIQKDSELIEMKRPSNIKYIENINVDSIVNYVTIDENVQVPHEIKVLEEETGEKVIKIVNREEDSSPNINYDEKIATDNNREIEIVSSKKSMHIIIDNAEKKTPFSENEENLMKKGSSGEDFTTRIIINAPTESDQNGEEKKIVLDQKLTEKESTERVSEVIDKKIELKPDNSSALSEEQKKLQDQYRFFQQQFLMWQQQLLQNQALLEREKLLPEAQLEELRQQQLQLQQTLFKQPFMMTLNSGDSMTSAALSEETRKVEKIEMSKPIQTLTNIEPKTNRVKEGFEIQLQDIQKESLNEENKITNQMKSDMFKRKAINIPKESPTYPLENESHTYPPVFTPIERQESFHFQSKEEMSETISNGSGRSSANSIDKSVPQIENSEFKEPPKTLYRKWESPAVKIGSWSERPRDNVPIKTDGTREIKFKPFLMPKSINQFVNQSEIDITNSQPCASTVATTTNITNTVSNSTNMTSTVASTVNMPNTISTVITTPAIVSVALGPKPFKATWKPTETLPKPLSKPAPVVLGFNQRIGIQNLDSDIRTAYKSYSRSVCNPAEVEDTVFKFSDSSDNDKKGVEDFPETNNRVKHAISRFSSFSGSQPSLAPNYMSQSHRSLSPPKVPIKTVSLTSLDKTGVSDHNPQPLKTDEHINRMTKSMQSINTLPSPTWLVSPLSSNTSVTVSSEPSNQSVKNYTTVIQVNNEHSSQPLLNISNNPPIAPPPPPLNFFKSGSQTLPSAKSSSSKPRFTMVRTDDGVQSSSSSRDIREELMSSIRNFGGRQNLNKVPVRQASWHFGMSN